MKPIKIILKNINILNLLLLATVIILFFEFNYPLLNKKIKVTLPKAKEVTIQSEEKVAPESSVSYLDFVSVAEKNLFHPERKIPAENKDEKVAIPKPDLVLYGTLITDNLSIAYIEDRKALYSTPGRGKRQTQLKKGDSISGYILREIEPNRIILVKGEEKLVVMLDDKEKRRGGETAASSASKAPAGFLPPTSASPVASQAGKPSPAAVTSSAPAQNAGAQVPGFTPSSRRAKVQMIQNEKLKMQRENFP
jgi:biopolymer transport protein ExbD